MAGKEGRTTSRVAPSLLRGLILVCLLLGGTAAAQDLSSNGGPGGAVLLFASLGSGLITLLFSVAGSLVMAQYNRNVAGAEAKIAELTRKIEAAEVLLRVTREEYARRVDLAGLDTLRQETRTEVAEHRREVRAELASLREHMDVKLGEIGNQNARILSLLDPARRA